MGIQDGRSFGEGQDDKWTAINRCSLDTLVGCTVPSRKPRSTFDQLDGSYNQGTLDLEGYNANHAQTANGSLLITASLDVTVDLGGIYPALPLTYPLHSNRFP